MKYRDRILSAAIRLVERNQSDREIVGDLEFLEEIDRILDDIEMPPARPFRKKEMRVLEYIHRIEEFGNVIRVWTSVSGIWTSVERRTQFNEIKRSYKGEDTIESICEAIGSLPFVNAVEVTNDNQGILIYPDWP